MKDTPRNNLYSVCLPLCSSGHDGVIIIIFLAICLALLVVSVYQFFKKKFLNGVLYFLILIFVFTGFQEYAKRSFCGRIRDASEYLDNNIGDIISTGKEAAYRLEYYKNKYGKYPESMEVITIPQINGLGQQFAPFVGLWRYHLNYKVASDGQTYELAFIGIDGEYGTDDDIMFEIASTSSVIDKTEGLKIIKINPKDFPLENTNAFMEKVSYILEYYKNKNGKYPDNLDNINEQAPEDMVFSLYDYQLRAPFHYKTTSDDKSYELRNLGDDEKYGTEDDIIYK